MLVSPDTGLALATHATSAPSEDESVQSLLGRPLPALRLVSTTGGEMNLATLASEPVVIYVHPGTETSREVPRDPDGLLGSGCTLQSRAFSEHGAAFAGRRFHVIGISARPPEEQRRFCRREGLRFALLSDAKLRLAEALDLPTELSACGERVYSRLTFIAHEGVIDRIFHPVPIPRRNALDVLAWLDKQGTVL